MKDCNKYIYLHECNKRDNTSSSVKRRKHVCQRKGALSIEEGNNLFLRNRVLGCMYDYTKFKIIMDDMKKTLYTRPQNSNVIISNNDKGRKMMDKEECLNRARLLNILKCFNTLEKNVPVYEYEHLLKCTLSKNVSSNVSSNIGGNIGSNIGGNIGGNIGSNIGGNIGSNIGGNIGSNIGSNVSCNIGSNIGSNVSSNVRSNVNSDNDIYEGECKLKNASSAFDKKLDEVIRHFLHNKNEIHYEVNHRDYEDKVNHSYLCSNNYHNIAHLKSNSKGYISDSNIYFYKKNKFIDKVYDKKKKKIKFTPLCYDMHKSNGRKGDGRNGNSNSGSGNSKNGNSNSGSGHSNSGNGNSNSGGGHSNSGNGNSNSGGGHSTNECNKFLLVTKKEEVKKTSCTKKYAPSILSENNAKLFLYKKKMNQISKILCNLNYFNKFNSCELTREIIKKKKKKKNNCNNDDSNNCNNDDSNNYNNDDSNNYNNDDSNDYNNDDSNNYNNDDCNDNCNNGGINDNCNNSKEGNEEGTPHPYCVNIHPAGKRNKKKNSKFTEFSVQGQTLAQGEKKHEQGYPNAMFDMRNDVITDKCNCLEREEDTTCSNRNRSNYYSDCMHAKKKKKSTPNISHTNSTENHSDDGNFTQKKINPTQMMRKKLNYKMHFKLPLHVDIKYLLQRKKKKKKIIIIKNEQGKEEGKEEVSEVVDVDAETKEPFFRKDNNKVEEISVSHANNRNIQKYRSNDDKNKIDDVIITTCNTMM
ncbi:transcription factor with AP2 domain(s) (ApiAP2) [Plasmodium malariae]|uniref:Transcription factor with AP2 domain(S) (ApiAP2) n=1 Tax=Plasmodium malariae TaxID=5858 RepID=A0A1A8WQX0_PLAMA|nr:transcription factor with AP2 domain(s) (ApiAP2) [Plasmodium malariae]